VELFGAALLALVVEPVQQSGSVDPSLKTASRGSGRAATGCREAAVRDIRLPERGLEDLPAGVGARL
jgi:hypothetical protein